MSRKELTSDELAALFTVDWNDESDDINENDEDSLDRLLEYLNNDYDKDEDNQGRLNLFSSKDEIIKQLCKLTLYDITIDEIPLIIDGTKKTYYNLRAVVPANKVLSQKEIDVIVRSLKAGYRLP